MRKIALISLTSLLLSFLATALIAPNISYAADIDTGGEVKWVCSLPDKAGTSYADQATCEKACESGDTQGFCTQSIVISPDYIVNMIRKYTQWFMMIAGLVAVIFIIWGGLKYMTARGDAAKAKTARQLILYALAGLAITLFAGGAVWTITNFLKTG